MPFDNYQNMLNTLMGGGYQGVGANAGGGVTTGANQYYHNPTPQTLNISNYVPTAQSQGTTAFGTPAKLNTMGVTNPWASMGKPEWYNPTGSYMVTPQGLAPSWAVTPNWMPSAWGGQLPMPDKPPGVYTAEMTGLGAQQGVMRGLAPTTGMAPYTPPAAGLGPMAGAVDFTTPNLGGGGGGAPQTPAGMTRGVPGGTMAPAGLGTGGSVGGGGSYGGERPAPGSGPVSQQRYTPGTNATYGMNRGAPSGPSVGGMGVPPSPNRFAPGNLPYSGGGMLSNYYAPQNNFAQLISQLSQAGIPPAVMMALAMRLQRGM